MAYLALLRHIFEKLNSIQSSNITRHQFNTVRLVVHILIRVMVMVNTTVNRTLVMVIVTQIIMDRLQWIIRVAHLRWHKLGR